MKLYGKVLWVDDRIETQFEGQILSSDGKRFYFNYSVWSDPLPPVSDQAVKFVIGKDGQIDSICDLCSTLKVA